MLVMLPTRAPLGRVRSSSFTGNAIANHVRTLCPKQYRALSVLHRRGSAAQVTATACPSTSIRPKSSGKIPRNPALGRAASSLHRPDCTWVSASGHPELAARDPTCPQCRKEDVTPDRLSQREAMWQKNMAFWKEFLHREPYDALFSRSNAMLKGLNWRESLEKEMRDYQKHMQDFVSDSSKFLSSSAAPQPEPQPQDAKTGKSSKTAIVEDIPIKKSSNNVTDTSSHYQGYGRWSVRTTDVQGRVKESNGEYVFDPISMRMIPAGNGSTEAIETSPPTTVKGKDAPEDYKYPWANETNFDHVEISESPQHELSKTKKTLETSWREESKHVAASTPVQKPGSVQDDLSSVGRIAHFRQTARGRLDTRASKLFARRHRGFKEMSAEEVAMHRTALMNLWARRHAEGKSGQESPADKRLQAEIKDVKQKMAAFETKQSPSLRPTIALSSDSLQSQKPSVAVGEGDLCPKSSSYTFADRWYKNKAPHARTDEEQRTHDMNLVRSVRQIYEDAYGPIDVNHQQGKILKSLESYEDRLGGAPYAYQQSTEKKTTTTPELDQYEEKLGSKPYAFDNSEPTLEQSLKENEKHIHGSAAYVFRGDQASMAHGQDKTRSALKRYEDRAGSNFLYANPPEAATASVTGRHDKAKTLEELLETQVEAERSYYAAKDLLPPENVPEVAGTTPAPPAMETASSADTQPRKAGLLEDIFGKLTKNPLMDQNIKSESTSEPANGLTNPVDPCLSSQSHSSIGNYASPTGFYRDPDTDYQPASMKEAKKEAQKLKQQKKASRHVRKEEPVFSGYKNNSDGWGGGRDGGNYARHFNRDRKRQRSVFRQTLLSASIIGLFCYLGGVTIELLRDRKALLEKGLNEKRGLAAALANNSLATSDNVDSAAKDDKVDVEKLKELAREIRAMYELELERLADFEAGLAQSDQSPTERPQGLHRPEREPKQVNVTAGAAAVFLLTAVLGPVAVVGAAAYAVSKGFGNGR